MTTPKQPAPVARKSHQDQGLVEIRRTFTFLTPLFGGGVWVDPDENTRHIKKYDEITPARGTAIRGQLRFWWRATHGLRPPTDGRPHNLSTLREREDALWGNASLVGKVNLRVEYSPIPLQTEEIFEVKPKGKGWKIEPKDAGLAYAAFPLQPKSEEEGSPSQHKPEVGKVYSCSATFELILTCPSQHKPEVEDALDVWLTFGGLGGRTRRGFGAICSGSSSQNPKALFERLKEGLEPLAGVSGFAKAKLVIQSLSKSKAIDALSGGLGVYRKFRQSRSKPPYGPSHWPEAEAIRAITGDSHSRYRGKRPLNVDKFPRAAFGMPIIFHFKDPGEPKDTALLPIKKERRASPLILRPFRNAQQKYDMLALVLHAPSAADEPCELKEQKAPKRTFGVETDLTPDEAKKIRPLGGNTDVLQAFLNQFRR